MSLKAFHIFFVMISVLVCGITGLWGVNQYLTEGGGGVLAIGVVGVLTALILVVYGFKFAKKLKGVSYL